MDDRASSSGECIHHRCAEQVQEAAQGRRDDGCRLHRRGAQRQRPGQRGGRHEGRQQGRAGGHLEGLGGAEDQHGAEDQFAADETGGAGDSEHGEAGGLDQLGGDGQPAPVEAVRQVAGDGGEKDARQELDQADQAQIQRAAGELVDLPADCHALDLAAAAEQDAGQPEKDEGAMPAQEVRRMGVAGRFAHSPRDRAGRRPISTLRSSLSLPRRSSKPALRRGTARRWLPAWPAGR
jgi:hypothetical protein